MEQAVTDFASMIDSLDLATTDPLGLGGLLMDACRVEQLMVRGAFASGDLLDTLLAAALAGLSQYVRQDDLRQPAWRRLAFRELGLAIGAHAIELIEHEAQPQPHRFSEMTRSLLHALAAYESVGLEIESFWLDPKHQNTQTWSEHRDINAVMLATSLVPEGCLVLQPKSKPSGDVADD